MRHGSLASQSRDGRGIDKHVRRPVVERLRGLGFELDVQANLVRSKEPRDISAPGSRVKVLVVPTNEELAMARETVAVINAGK